MILASAFPPSGESGVHRTLKFVKFLGRFGWRPVVVSPSSDAYPVLDWSLQKDIPEDVAVYRARFPALVRRIRTWASTSASHHSAVSSRRHSRSWVRFLRNFNLLLVPDSYIAWLPSAVARCISAFRRHRPRVLLVSSPPPSVTVIGAIVSRLLSVPLIIDFRDGWTVEPYYRDGWRKRNPVRYWVEARLETMVLKRAKRIICQQAVMARDYVDKYPWLREKITVLNNGFDEEDFAEAQPYPFDRPALVYTGYLEERRNPNRFFQALVLLRNSRPELVEGLRVLLIGRAREDYPSLADDLDLGGVVEFQDHVDHDTAISMIRGALGLLLLTGGDESELPGKLFEYLGARRPIFAVAHPCGQSAQIIRAAKAGLVVSGATAKEIAVGLETFLDGVASGQWAHQQADRYRFTRQYAAEQLANVLNQVGTKQPDATRKLCA